MQRYLILFSAVIMQMCLGATYSWSVYVKPLRELTGLSQGTAQLPFSVFYFAFPATMIFSGTLLPRLGTRRAAMLGGVIFGSGWLLAMAGRFNFVFTTLGIGLLAGIGVGLAYIVPITVCIQWFPKHKGLVTGIAVAGFGGGAALVSQLGGAMTARWGLSPFDAFGVFGVAFLLLAVGAGATMQAPPNQSTGNRARLNLNQILARREFWILYPAMVSGLAAGFAVNANLKEFSAIDSVQTGILAVSLFAVGNAAGRVLWGFLFDRSRASITIGGNLLAQTMVLLLALWLLNVPGAAGLPIFALLTGFNYGGVLVLYASSAAHIWGSDHVGQVYGFLFSANIVASFSPVVAGSAFDRLGNFNLVLGVLAAGMLLMAMVIFRYSDSLNRAETTSGVAGSNR